MKINAKKYNLNTKIKEHQRTRNKLVHALNKTRMYSLKPCSIVSKFNGLDLGIVFSLNAKDLS